MKYMCAQLICQGLAISCILLTYNVVLERRGCCVFQGFVVLVACFQCVPTCQMVYRNDTHNVCTDWIENRLQRKAELNIYMNDKLKEVPT